MLASFFANHTGRSPAITAAHAYGNRCRQSVANDNSTSTASGRRCIAAANSNDANSATNGVPSEPAGTSCSRPGTTGPSPLAADHNTSTCANNSNRRAWIARKALSDARNSAKNSRRVAGKADPGSVTA